MLTAALLAAQASAAWAADEASEAPDSLAVQSSEGEITVTARRMSETLQNVPATVTVFTANTLVAAGVQKTEDFVALTPGVTIISGAVEPGDPQINIRGVNGVRDAEPSVALSVDGIIKTNVSALNQDQGDVTQIEVVKGPQGAIYGRNATSGAFIMTTRKPGDVLQARFRMAAQEAETYSLSASVNGPLSDDIGFLVSGNYYNTRGQYKITAPDPASNGQYMDGSEEYNFNGRLFITPTDRLELDVKGHYGHREGGAYVFNAVFALPAFAVARANPLFYENASDHKFRFDPSIAPKSWLTTKEASIKGDYDLGGGRKLTGWLSYAHSARELTGDGTSSSFRFFNTSPSCIASVAALNAIGYKLASPQFLTADVNTSLIGPFSPTRCDGGRFQRVIERDLSGEIRLSGSTGAVDWMAGVYYLDIGREVVFSYLQDTGNGVPRTPVSSDPRFRTEQTSWDKFNTRAYAVFGSADWKIAPRLSLSAALRYDNERRKVHNLIPPDFRTQYIDFNGPPYTGGAPLNPALLNGPIPDQAKTFDQIEPKVSLTWKPDPAFTLYASYGKGFKSGGFNNSGAGTIIDIAFNRTLGANLAITDNYRKETSDGFEAGFKKNFGSKLFVEGAGYYTRVKDQQSFEFFVGTFGILRVVSNIDRVDLWGGELSANYRITPQWSIFAGGNVIGSEIKKNAVRPDTVGNKSPHTPDFTINAGTQLDVPLNGSLSFVGRTDVRVTGPTWFSTVQDERRPTIFNVPGAYDRLQRRTFTTVNLRLGVKGEHWEAAFIASNLFNEKYLQEAVVSPEFGGAFVSPSALRRLGAELRWNF
jgi:iron complex outermembrane receptor protein